MIGGNALGDGKPKNNGTDTPRQELFAEKYRKNLKTDVNDILEEEDDDLKDIMGMSEESIAEGAVNNSIMDKLNADDDD